MRYYTGTIRPVVTSAPPKRTVEVSIIDGSVTIFGPQGREFTLHRVGKDEPPRFYMIYPDKPNMPVVGDPDDVYEDPFTEFTVVGSSIIEGELMKLTTNDGCSMPVFVHDFNVHPPREWPKSHKWVNNRGLTRKKKGRRSKGHHS